MSEKLRVAAQQALKALEAGPDVDPIFAGETEDALRVALADFEPVQEPEPDVPESSFGNIKPVGWFESPHGAFRANPQYLIRFPSQLLSWQIPLYTAPPQRPPLTDEEIRSVLEAEFIGFGEKRTWNNDLRLSRAVERAVRGEKE